MDEIKPTPFFQANLLEKNPDEDIQEFSECNSPIDLEPHSSELYDHIRDDDCPIHNIGMAVREKI